MIATEPTEKAESASRRIFWPVLLIIALLGLALRLYVGRHTVMSYDEWQHVFIAAGARMADVYYEVSTNAHPILFFLLLRGLLKLGHGQLLYRAISIAAGTGSILLIGLICRKTLRSQLLQLLCPAALAVSYFAITMSIQVRSYELAIFLSLLAFLAYLDLVPAASQPVRLRSYLLFTGAATAAIWSHYSVIFFLGACLAAPAALAIVSRDFRKRWSSTLNRRTIWLSVAAVAIPLIVFALHIPHMMKQPIQGYVYDYYPGMSPSHPDETIAGFAVRNSRNLYNLFSPLEIEDDTEFLALAAVLGVAAIAILWKASRAAAGLKPGSRVPLAFAVLMVLAMLAASIVHAYPYGGLLRHQYIVAPFLLLAAFVVLDSLASLAGRFSRLAVPALIGAAIALHPVVSGETLVDFRDTILLSDEFNAFTTEFPQARAVYLDSFHVWGYFVHTDDGRRRFVRRIADPAWVDQYRIVGGAHDGTMIFYDKTRYSVNFADATLYETLAACLRQSGEPELDVFWFSPGDAPLTLGTLAMKRQVEQNAEAVGLIATKVAASDTMVFAGFRLADAEHRNGH